MERQQSSNLRQLLRPSVLLAVVGEGSLASCPDSSPAPAAAPAAPCEFPMFVMGPHKPRASGGGGLRITSSASSPIHPGLYVMLTTNLLDDSEISAALQLKKSASESANKFALCSSIRASEEVANRDGSEWTTVASRTSEEKQRSPESSNCSLRRKETKVNVTVCVTMSESGLSAQMKVTKNSSVSLNLVDKGSATTEREAQETAVSSPKEQRDVTVSSPQVQRGAAFSPPKDQRGAAVSSPKGQRDAAVTVSIDETELESEVPDVEELESATRHEEVTMSLSVFSQTEETVSKEQSLEESNKFQVETTPDFSSTVTSCTTIVVAYKKKFISQPRPPMILEISPKQKKIPSKAKRWSRRLPTRLKIPRRHSSSSARSQPASAIPFHGTRPFVVFPTVSPKAASWSKVAWSSVTVSPPPSPPPSPRPAPPRAMCPPPRPPPPPPLQSPLPNLPWAPLHRPPRLSLPPPPLPPPLPPKVGRADWDFKRLLQTAHQRLPLMKT